MNKMKPIYRYSRGGKTLLHKMRVNPTMREIDDFYRKFREDLKSALYFGDLEKDGAYFHLVRNNLAECGMYLPFRRWFTLQDVVESKRIFKKHRDLFLKIRDWNDLGAFQKLLKRMRVKKPVLTAALIFGAWQHDNINVHPRGRK